MRLRRLFAGLAPALLLCASQAAAHGGVSMKDDVCIMHVGPYKSHFVGYQPELRATQEFCEDIPELGRAVIVMDFIDAPLRDMGVQFLVLKDVHGLGKRTTYMDLGGADDIKSATVYSTAVQHYPRGTVTVDQRFTTPGWYVGVLTATDDKTGTVYRSVFPFQVGVKKHWRYFPLFALVVALSLLLYRVSGRRPAVKA